MTDHKPESPPAATVQPLWTVKELAAFLGLSIGTVRVMCSTQPERLPPRVAHLASARWSPAVCERWSQTPAAKRPKAGRPRLPV